MRSPPADAQRPVPSLSCADRSLGSDRTFPASRHQQGANRRPPARCRDNRPGVARSHERRRRYRQLPDRFGDSQISEAGLRSLRRSDPQGAACGADRRPKAESRFHDRAGLWGRANGASVAPPVPRKGGQRSTPAGCLRRSESECGRVAAQRRLSEWGTTSGRVLCEALRNVHLDKLLVFLPVLLIGLRFGREGMVGVRQAGLEITDDRAEKARREKPRPEGPGRILTDGRQLSQGGPGRRLETVSSQCQAATRAAAHKHDVDSRTSPSPARGVGRHITPTHFRYSGFVRRRAPMPQPAPAPIA